MYHYYKIMSQKDNIAALYSIILNKIKNPIFFSFHDANFIDGKDCPVTLIMFPSKVNTKYKMQGGGAAWYISLCRLCISILGSYNSLKTYKIHVWENKTPNINM